MYTLEQGIQDVVVVKLDELLYLRKVGGQGLRMILAIKFLVHWEKQGFRSIRTTRKSYTHCCNAQSGLGLRYRFAVREG